MENTPERRGEKRLRYYWPVWFAEDFDAELLQGQMIDVSSSGAAFTCRGECGWVHPGRQVTARFSVPRYGPDESFGVANFIRPGHICRVEHINSQLRRVAIQFFEPLPFRPGEQEENQFESQEDIDAMAVC